MTKKIINSHIHARIEKLAKSALEKGLIIQFERINNNYLIAKPGELPIEYNPISAGTILITLLSG